jgi:hypothetical protein
MTATMKTKIRIHENSVDDPLEFDVVGSPLSIAHDWNDDSTALVLSFPEGGKLLFPKSKVLFLTMNEILSE